IEQEKRKVPSCGCETGAGSVAVELTRPEGGDDGVDGLGSGPEAGERRGVAVAEGDPGPGVLRLVIYVGHDLGEDPSDGQGGGSHQRLVGLKPPPPSRDTAAVLLHDRTVEAEAGVCYRALLVGFGSAVFIEIRLARWRQCPNVTNDLSNLQ
ncbi:hypothetical protein GW17_00019689, partial [Ensete ventricosum]